VIVIENSPRRPLLTNWPGAGQRQLLPRHWERGAGRLLETDAAQRGASRPFLPAAAAVVAAWGEGHGN